jgi:hypothetical protein
MAYLTIVAHIITTADKFDLKAGFLHLTDITRVEKAA